jgi:calcineurin-like phosphoesterase family protein
MSYNIWFTSDLHLSHHQEFLYGPRGFKDEQEMNEAIVENWNSVVKPEDIVWNLGDMVMNDVGNALSYLKRLNGSQYWLLGNHDTDNKVLRITDECWNITVPIVNYANVIKAGGMTLYISHYPTLTANFDDKHFSRHVISLHGHTHQKTNWLQLDNPFLYHVGLDSHNCTPVHIDEVIADIRNRWNELGANTNILKCDNMYGIPRR